ncbi:MAG: hypothetical protein K2Q29_12455 [Sphingomonadales bacterium]|nr:hypothetical protein [Sphingomonadales bacterium]
MPSSRARELWSSGIPLSRAWLEFAPAELRSEFDCSPALLQSLDEIPRAASERGIGTAMTDIARNYHRRMQLEVDLKEHLLTELFNRQLLATGYRLAPSRSQAPVLIDPERFDYAEPDWRDETFEAEGITYSRIRVTDPSNCQPTPVKDKGSREAIDAAIHHLKCVNPGFCKLKRKIACEEIRKFLGEEENAGNGLSFQNLSKAIVAKCGPKRISRKQN